MNNHCAAPEVLVVGVIAFVGFFCHSIEVCAWLIFIYIFIMAFISINFEFKTKKKSVKQTTRI